MAYSYSKLQPRFVTNVIRLMCKGRLKSELWVWDFIHNFSFDVVGIVKNNLQTRNKKKYQRII